MEITTLKKLGTELCNQKNVNPIFIRVLAQALTLIAREEIGAELENKIIKIKEARNEN